MSEQASCEWCGRPEYVDRGSWNKDLGMFFCCNECHWDWADHENEVYEEETY